MTLNKISYSDFNVNILKKIPEVLGKSSDEYLVDHVNKIYELPARETFLMAMSSSYELQAATYDYMKELDRQQCGYRKCTIEELNELISVIKQRINQSSTDMDDDLINHQDAVALLERAQCMVSILNQLWLGWLKDNPEINSTGI